MRRRVVGLALTIVLFSSLGHAQGDRERAAARSLASEGVTAYEEGRNAVALEQFQRAYQLAPIPTIGLWLARALAKDGQLVEANERYLAAIRYEIKANDPSVFGDAASRISPWVGLNSAGLSGTF
jgi:Flp pilus assembly protein TadD